VPLDVAEVDALWALIENHNLLAYVPGPAHPSHADDPPLIRIEVSAERRGGARVERDHEWTSPTSADTAFGPVIAAARDLALRIGKVDLRYFPGGP
jgi:hypothetical protein